MTTFWRRVSIAVLIAAIASSPAAGAIKSAAQNTGEDARVIEAAFAHIRSMEFVRTRSAMPPILAMSVSVCERARNHDCINKESIDIFREAAIRWVGYSSSTGPQPGVAMPSLTARSELLASVANRNAERHPLPAISVPGVALIPLSDEPEVMIRDRDRSKYSGFSLPGYTADGRALLYGFFACGGCGEGWLFLLQKDANGWQVRSRYMLWVR